MFKILNYNKIIRRNKRYYNISYRNSHSNTTNNTNTTTSNNTTTNTNISNNILQKQQIRIKKEEIKEKKIKIIQRINDNYNIIYKDYNGYLQQENSYKQQQEGQEGQQIERQQKGQQEEQFNYYKQQLNKLISFFLPKGYPQSIEKGYSSYAIYQSFGYIFSTASSVLSTQSLLYALGLGEGSIPLAATLNWIIKDGLGQLGGVIFASLINNQFDQNPKKWRMISSISMDISSFIELLTPLAPKYFILLASIANIGKNISYLSASASRVAIHKSFTIHENLADLTAKTGSQTILSSLIGTSLGIFLSTTINNSYTLNCFTFTLCSLLHLSCNYLSLNYVTIKTLNLSTLDDLFYHYLQLLNSNIQENSITTINELEHKNQDKKVLNILTPKEYSHLNSSLLSILTDNSYNNHNQQISKLIPIKIGEDISNIIKNTIDLEVIYSLLLILILLLLILLILLFLFLEISRII